MSGFKNSPFSKRLRASHRDGDLDDGEYPKKHRVNGIFGAGPSASSSRSTPSLDSRPTTDGSSGGPDSPVDTNHKFSFTMNSAARLPRIQKEYGDRFVPSKDTGDLRTSYHLMEDGGAPSTPSKNRIIPSESDALKGSLSLLYLQLFLRHLS